jgi:TonB family protein
MDIDFRPVGSSFSAPVGAAGVNIPGGGQDARGFVEVVPYNTRRPNVPEVAWQNRISGWVLVAFTVTPQGRTRDVRVLDARPRGVFEESVVAAVKDWQYRLEFSSRNPYSVSLTQKVEVEWKNYPQNLPNVD